MLTKAIVEEIISPYQVKVRIPILDRVTTSSVSTSNDNLNVATICSLPNCYINLQVGDVVFVGFEDNTYYKAVVLGHLCRQAATSSKADVLLNSIDVEGTAKLPENTTIGSLTPLELSCLSGCSSNIQKQISNINDRLNVIMEKLFPENGGS